jgi:hypothetical protein
MALPVGVLSCWGLYKILQNQWSKAPIQKDSEVLDRDLMS